LVLSQFKRLHDWTPFRGPGHFPDADMLPIGVLQMGRNKTHFTQDEQTTLLSLWCIARSPLMIGADLTKLDGFTLSLLTNDEVLAVDQNSGNNRELFNRDGFYAWIADAPGSTDKYLALFNVRKPQGDPNPGLPTPPVKFSEFGFGSTARVRDLWRQTDLGSFTNDFAPAIKPHGAGLYRISSAP
jgi:hypothetical protein